MEITALAPFLCAGENGSRTLRVSVAPDIAANRDVRIAFITPSGKSLLTPSLLTDNGECDYPVPAEILDRYGRLHAQIIVNGENGYCLKSDIFDFEVYPGLDIQSGGIEDGEPVTLARVAARLDAAENKLAGLENYALPTASASVKGGVKVGANLNISADGVLSATTSEIGRYIIAVSYEYGGAETPFTNPTAALSDIAAIASHLAAGEDIILKLTAQGVTDVYYARLWGQSGNAYYNFQLWDGGYLYDVTVWTGSGSIMIQRKL